MSVLSASVNFINQRCFIVLKQYYPANASNTTLRPVWRGTSFESQEH